MCPRTKGDTGTEVSGMTQLGPTVSMSCPGVGGPVRPFRIILGGVKKDYRKLNFVHVGHPGRCQCTGESGVRRRVLVGYSPVTALESGS